MSTATPTRSSGVEVAKGIGACFLLNGLQLGIGWLLLRGPDPLLAFAIPLIAGFGVVQVVYVVPLILALQRKGRPDFAKGIAIGASIAFLLNATRFGLVITGRIKILN